MDKIKLNIFALSSSQSHSGAFALILGEEDGDRRLPIIIAMPEAQAIALQLEKVKVPRPLTHDLFNSFAEQFFFKVEEAIIAQIKEGIFYGEVICIDKRDGRRVVIDARSSDAIAIALRFDVPIYTYESVLNEAGISLEEINKADKQQKGEEGHLTDEEEFAESSLEENFEGELDNEFLDYTKLSISKLQEILAEAIKTEDYEKAAEIRDELSNRGVE